MRVLHVTAIACLMQGCTCARPDNAAGLGDAGGVGGDAAFVSSLGDGGVRAMADDAGRHSPQFSLPIAAARDPSAARTFVAGLRVKEKAITVTLVDDDGHSAWTVDAFTDVAWSPDAELHLYAATGTAPAGGAGGAWVVWRGLIAGKLAQKARYLGGPQSLGTAEDVGGANCGNGTALYYIAGATLSVREATGVVVQIKLRDPDADISLLCSAGRSLLLSESDDGATLLVPRDGGATRLNAFDANSEGRTTMLFAGAGHAGIVRVGERDAIVRELVDDKLAPARSERVPFAEDDDIVAVDAVGNGPVIFTTHEVEMVCDAGATIAPGISAYATGASVKKSARDVGAGNATGGGGAGNASGGVGAGNASFDGGPGRASSDGGASTSFIEIAPPECGRERGPYWSTAVGGDVVFAWIERVRQQHDKAKAPIAGIGFARVLADGSLGDHGFIDQNADGIVDAACDDKGCFAAALVRIPGDDDSKPEVVRVLPLRSSPPR